MIASALIALAHAYRHGRLHLLLWLCSLIAGSATHTKSVETANVPARA